METNDKTIQQLKKDISDYASKENHFLGVQVSLIQRLTRFFYDNGNFSLIATRTYKNKGHNKDKPSRDLVKLLMDRHPTSVYNVLYMGYIASKDIEEYDKDGVTPILKPRVANQSANTLKNKAFTDVADKQFGKRKPATNQGDLKKKDKSFSDEYLAIADMKPLDFLGITDRFIDQLRNWLETGTVDFSDVKRLKTQLSNQVTIIKQFEDSKQDAKAIKQIAVQVKQAI